LSISFNTPDCLIVTIGTVCENQDTSLQGKLDADYSQYASGRYVPHWAGGKGMDGHTCVHEYGIPNFYFHLTMAYALLRRAGVDLGKRDYLGGLNLQ
ncbi:DUF1993 family protein, partial [Aeromonas veronii]